METDRSARVEPEWQQRGGGGEGGGGAAARGGGGEYIPTVTMQAGFTCKEGCLRGIYVPACQLWKTGKYDGRWFFPVSVFITDIFGQSADSSSWEKHEGW